MCRFVESFIGTGVGDMGDILSIRISDTPKIIPEPKDTLYRYLAGSAALLNYFFDSVKEKELKVFTEYPSYLLSVRHEETVHAKLERAIVNTFLGMPDSLQIIADTMPKND